MFDLFLSPSGGHLNITITFLCQFRLGLAETLHDLSFLGSFTPCTIYILFFGIGLCSVEFLRGGVANHTHKPHPFSAGVDLTLKDHQNNNIKHNFDNYLVFTCYICFVKYNIETVA